MNLKNVNQIFTHSLDLFILKHFCAIAHIGTHIPMLLTILNNCIYLPHMYKTKKQHAY